MFHLFSLLRSKHLNRRLVLCAILISSAVCLVAGGLRVSAQKRGLNKQRRKPKAVVTRPAKPKRVVALEPTTQCPATPPTNPEDCGGKPCVVDITENDPDPREKLKEHVKRENVTVRLSPNLDLDFTGLPDNWFPIRLGRCATLMSVNSFETGSSPRIRPSRPTRSRTTNQRGIVGGNIGPIEGIEVERPAGIGSARTPKSLGPILRYGTNHVIQPGLNPYNTFLQVHCDDYVNGDGARISGFRLYGPTFGPQTTHEVGIRIVNCVNVEISNMEVAGWGESAIRVQDDDPALFVPEGCEKVAPPVWGSEPDPQVHDGYRCPVGVYVSYIIPGPGGRISRPDQIRIFGNFIHHNQHPNHDDKAAGYGVNVARGAWALISENVFDFNRHAIAGGADAGGYIARRNLVLKGGGIHGRTLHYYTHQFDVHGDNNCGPGSILSDSIWNCGNAALEVGYESNAFQFTNNHAIKVRGKPRTLGYFSDNIFPHQGVVDSPVINGTDGGIAVYDGTNIEIRPGNVAKVDSFGKYQVCDFDGDGLDDLFLTTGATWWYSSEGKYQWSYMSAKKEKWDQIKVGYFDNDLRCDVLTERGGQWLYSSGGYSDWQILGQFEAPMAEIEFGRFADSPSDPAGVRRTPHAFRRAPDGQWYLTALFNYRPGDRPVWEAAGSSGQPLEALRFGDFDGDGITDVLGKNEGRWAFSKGARTTWENLNSDLGNNVTTLIIANMDTDDKLDDVLRFQRERRIYTFDDGQQAEQIEFTWWRSKDGRGPWEHWHTDNYVPRGRPKWDPALDLPLIGFIGRFKSSGVGTFIIDPSRIGMFFSKAEFDAGRSAYWRSEFAY